MLLSSRGIIPLSANDLPPRIVCVLPVPVFPYANTQTSPPLKRCLTVGATGCVLAKIARDNQSLPRTFAIKELLLRRVLFIDRAELEAEGLCIILGTGYPNDSRVCRVFALGGFRCDNSVFAQFVLQ
jgi:hypothetical protein